MSNISKINKMFSEGNSCLKSVFLPYAEEHGIGKNQAIEMIRIPFAGKNICGAVAGALKVIELKYPDNEIYKRNFVNEFEELYESITCYKIKENFKNNSSCTKLVNDTAKILDSLK